MVEETKTSLHTRANDCIARLLRSPFHSVLDRSTMLVTVTGRKTGIAYTLPVNYVRDGQSLVVLSRTDRTWWRNARNASVEVHIDGRDFSGDAEIIEEPGAVAAAIYDLIARVPAFCRMFHIKLDGEDEPSQPERVAQLIENRVVVRVSNLHPADLRERPTAERTIL